MLRSREHPLFLLISGGTMRILSLSLALCTSLILAGCVPPPPDHDCYHEPRYEAPKHHKEQKYHPRPADRHDDRIKPAPRPDSRKPQLKPAPERKPRPEEQSRFEKPRVDKRPADKSHVERPRPDKPRPGNVHLDKPRMDKDRPDGPRPDQPRR